jgi:hypothetical protein
MKKRLILILIACTAALCSCGQSADGSTSESTTAETTTRIIIESTTAASSKAPETTVAEESLFTQTAESSQEATSSESKAETTASSPSSSPASTTAAAESLTSAAETEHRESTAATSQALAEEIGKCLPITNLIPMAAAMIDAEEGVSFKVDGNKFEIYKYPANDEKLKDAESGSLTVSIQGFGEYTSKCAVNGCFVMIYETENSAVIDAFKKIRT